MRCFELIFHKNRDYTEPSTSLVPGGGGHA